MIPIALAYSAACNPKCSAMIEPTTAPSGMPISITHFIEAFMRPEQRLRCDQLPICDLIRVEERSAEESDNLEEHGEECKGDNAH